MPHAQSDKPIAPEDLRRHRRYHTRVTGRLIAADSDMACTIVNISAGGVQLKADVTVREGDEVALSIPKIGFMRGAVCRLDGGMISVAFNAPRTKTTRLVDRITKYFTGASGPGLQDNKS